MPVTVRVSDALYHLIALANIEDRPVSAFVRGMIFGELMGTTGLRQIFETSHERRRDADDPEEVSTLREALKEAVGNAKGLIRRHERPPEEPLVPYGSLYKRKIKDRRRPKRSRKPLKKYSRQMKVKVFDDNGRQIREWAAIEDRTVSDTVRKIISLVLLRRHAWQALLVEPEMLNELLQEIDREIKEEEPREKPKRNIYSRKLRLRRNR